MPVSRAAVRPLYKIPGTCRPSRNDRTRRVISAMSMPMGQICSHLPHMVQIHGQRDWATRSTMPKETMRTILRGSKSSTPDTGQALAHMAHVRQTSCS